jgi:hypothetical protein
MINNSADESLLKNWAASQQKLLADWLETLRKFGGIPTMELWKATIDAWQNSVKQTLDAQTEWTHRWIEVLTNAKGTPEELQGLVRQGREQLQQWAEAERDLWQNWFNIVREINFKPESADKQPLSNDLLQLWQDNAHKMLDAQASFVRRLTTGITGTKKQG